MNTNDYDSTKLCTIREALEISGFENAYFRKLIFEGKIEATKSAIPGTKIDRWLVDRDSLNSYISRAKHSQRKDGRNKYVIYLTPAEFEQLAKLAEKAKFDLIIDRANKTKKGDDVEAEEA